MFLVFRGMLGNYRPAKLKKIINLQLKYRKKLKNILFIPNNKAKPNNKKLYQLSALFNRKKNIS
jgi:hypothetical protein